MGESKTVDGQVYTILSNQEDPEAEVTTISILFLGDAGVGKSSFLSRLTLGHHSNDDDDQLPPYELPRLDNSQQPFEFRLQMQRQRWRFLFYDNSAPMPITDIRPNLIVLCFDITNRASLTSVHTKWKHLLDTHFNYDERMPIMVLGLKRDLRREWTPAERKVRRGATLMPQEGVHIASQMRCDLYAECSSLTGELFREAAEDLAKLAGRKQAADKFGACVIL